MLRSELDLEDGLRAGEQVAILVGPNGAGKSNFLLKLAERNRYLHEVAVICNTAYDRFAGLRGVQRISAGKGFHSPMSIIKRCVLATMDTSDSRYFQIGSILEYCGYAPRFGFKIRPAKREDRKLSDLYFTNDTYRGFVDLIERSPHHDTVWVDASSSGARYPYTIDIVGILSLERELRKDRVLRGIDIHLERRDDAREIELRQASSGELSLMSSMIFLVSSLSDNPVVVIDEPENSLHPTWQREYIDTILTTLRYHGAGIVVATHSPIIVTGAIAQNPGSIAVFQIRDGRPRRLDLDHGSTGGSIEELLWRAFEVVTPASHFVSEELVGAVSKFEAGTATKGEVFQLIERMKSASFDPKQEAFLEAVSQLVVDVERNLAKDDGATS